MQVSSRTPEGSPHRCPLCGKSVCIDPSDPAGDAPCPNCGHLLRWFRRTLSERLGVDPKDVHASSSFINDLGADSLDTVELVMELEDEFGITIPDEKATQIRTVRDAIRLIEQGLRDKRVPDQDEEELGDEWVPDQDDE